MSNAVVSHVYRCVIDDVISQVRGDFEDMGIDDSILQELQRSWESKVARSRVANFGFKDDGYYEEDGADNNNNNAAGTVNDNTNNNNTNNDQSQLQYSSEYQTPSAASLANLAATATAVANAGSRPQYGLPPLNNNNNRVIPDPTTLHQYQMMPPKPQQQNNNLPGLQLPGLPPTRPNLPQNDGANDDPNVGGDDQLTTEEIDQRIEDMIQSSSTGNNDEITFTASSFSGEPLALDSLPESVKELMKEAKDRAVKAGAISKRSRIAQLDGESDESPAAASGGAAAATGAASTSNNNTSNDDDINSDLDDTDDDDDDGEGGEEIEHIILCLYDKVTRTKNKWKCILKDGIMLVNGRDYLFHRANGDFEW